MRQPKHYSLMRPWLLAIILTMMAMAVPPALASNFTIEGSNNTFIIKRDNTSTEETVYYRTVSMSALAGVHFTHVSDRVVFQVGDDSYTVTVNENAASTLDDVYHYQTDNFRTYRFEVLDYRMQQLVNKTRKITYGNNYKVNTTYLNKSVTDLIYFTDAGNWASGSGNKYLDIYNEASQNGYIQVTDAGYSQGSHPISVDQVFNGNTGVRSFLNSLGCKMYTTIGFTQKEEADGYQYIQVLADNNSTYDGNDGNGTVSTPSTSLYKACFILSYTPSGSVMSDDHYQFFPHRYDYVDKASEISAGITNYEFDYDNSHLYKQAYRSNSFKASTSGSLVLPVTTSFLCLRFDAAGSGSDTWDFKNLFARVALVDPNAPTLLAAPVLSEGPYTVGGTFYVSVIFNEPVHYSTAPTLTTTWGSMNCVGGVGSNVLTFKGTINASHGDALSVNGLGGGTISDLAGNAFSGSISATFNNATAVARYTFDSATGTLTLNCGAFSNDNKWGDDVPAAAVTSVIASADVSFTGDCSNLFYSFNNCTSMVLGDVNTGALTIMDHMFYGCSSLRALDLSGWNTASVTNMSSLFYNCSRLTTLNLSGWNTASVTNMSNMFRGCSSLTTLNISGWNTASVNNMSYMFFYCPGLTTLNLSGWNTASVNNMSYMFNSCSSLTTLDLSGWNTASVTNMSYMFRDCSGLTTLNISNLNTASVTNMSEMFKGCSSLTTLNISGWNTASVNNMSYMFQECSGLTTLNISEWNTASVTNMSEMFYNCSSLTTLDISGWNTASVTNMSEMFYKCSSLTTLNISEWNTARVKNMSYMFQECSGLTTLNISSWNTASVTNMTDIFYNCSSLTTLDISDWNTARVTDMTGVFKKCSSLTTLDLSGWNTANVTSMRHMFYDCSSLNTIYASSAWSTANVTESEYMFNGCTNLVGGMGTTYDTGHTNAEYARYDRGADEPGYLTGVFTLTLPNGVTTTTPATLSHGGVDYYKGGMAITLAYTPPDGTRCRFTVGGTDIEGDTFQMPFADSEVGIEFQARYTFDSETGTLTLNWGEFNKDNKWGSDVPAAAVKSVTASADVSFTGSCYNLFSNFTNCTSMNLGNANTDALINVYDMFYNCSSLTTLDLSGWNTANVTDMSSLFYNCSSLTTLNLSGWNTASVKYMNDMFYGCSSLTTLDVSDWNTASVTGMNYMFENCSSLTTLDLSEWNTANVTGMSNMFYGCSSLTTLDISDWNTASVYYMFCMFYGCSSLTTLDISDWNTASVTGMSSMFQGCSSLTTLDLSGWNTANVAGMGYMFYNCSNLTTLNLSGWNTAGVTDMRDMFEDCSSLTTLDISNWNTASVTYMSSMFEDCSSLTTLDLSGWNTASVTYMDCMFLNCQSLTTIYAGSAWSTANVQSSWQMFGGCTHLVGGMGTTYDADHITAEYARYDRPDLPGYFTEKSALALGDLNGDGNVDVIDVSVLIDIILDKPVTIAAGAVTDINGDGNTDVIDVSFLIDMILQ